MKTFFFTLSWIYALNILLSFILAIASFDYGPDKPWEYLVQWYCANPLNSYNMEEVVFINLLIWSGLETGLLLGGRYYFNQRSPPKLN